MATMPRNHRVRLTALIKLAPFLAAAAIGKLAALSWPTFVSLIVLVAVGVWVAPPGWLARALSTLRADVEDDEATRRVRAKDALGGHRRDGRALLATRPDSEKEFRAWARQWANATDTTIQSLYGLTEAENFFRQDEDLRSIGTEAFMVSRMERLGELIARDTLPLLREGSG